MHGRRLPTRVSSLYCKYFRNCELTLAALAILASSLLVGNLSFIILTGLLPAPAAVSMGAPSLSTSSALLAGALSALRPWPDAWMPGHTKYIVQIIMRTKGLRTTCYKFTGPWAIPTSASLSGNRTLLGSSSFFALASFFLATPLLAFPVPLPFLPLPACPQYGLLQQLQSWRQGAGTFAIVNTCPFHTSSAYGHHQQPCPCTN